MSRQEYIKRLKTEIRNLEKELKQAEEMQKKIKTSKDLIVNNTIINCGGEMQNVHIGKSRYKSSSQIKKDIEGLKKAVRLMESMEGTDKTK